MKQERRKFLAMDRHGFARNGIRKPGTKERWLGSRRQNDGWEAVSH